ncbi:unnamed protein product [Colias eurytheme]|nr:unnamed protein product [Colias eurytheme]
MCALFLSGVQKEDLDVSMLIKLQRYNVNIDEINNSQMREKCVTHNVSKSKTSIIEKSETPRPPFNKTRLQVENTKAVEQIKETSDEKYLQNKDTILPWPYERNKTKKPIIETKPTNTIEYIRGQPDIASVMKFWENYAASSSNKPKHSSIEVHQINSRRTTESTMNIETDSKKSDVIEKLIEQLNNLNKKDELQAPIQVTPKIITESPNINAEDFKISNNQQIQQYKLSTHDQ